MSATADVPKKIPAHIPPELVWDRSFDEFTAEGDDPFLAITRMHDLPPVIWATDASYGRPGWVATRHDVISEIFIDHEHFSGEREGMPASMLGVPLRLNPIEIDPPEHHGHRRNLNPVFTPKAMNAMGESVSRTCRELIVKFADKGGCEFIHDFAIPFPTYVFLDVMDMPRAMAGDFLEWEDTLMRGADPAERGGAARSIFKYLEKHKEGQMDQPTNDLNRAITTAMFHDRDLTHIEKMGMYYVLYVGGLDTVYSTLGWVMRHLATHPDLQERLRDNPEDIPAAVEEFARAFSVVVTHRQLRDDYTFHGIPMKQGEEINLPISLADRDPAVFDNPHEVDIDRKSRHINFGTGVHSCLGIHLAKREIRTVIEEFLASFRNIRIKDGETYRYHTGRTFGLEYLPLVWV
ncbi:MAG: cytochrome P450 [Novosphingobium sp.]|nr:cytochrome P450 [Novosphingobium sp.]